MAITARIVLEVFKDDDDRGRGREVSVIQASKGNIKGMKNLRRLKMERASVSNIQREENFKG